MQILGKSPLLSHKTTLKQHINEREKPIFKTTTTHLPNTKQKRVQDIKQNGFFAQRKDVCVGVSLYLCRSAGDCSGQPMH